MDLMTSTRGSFLGFIVLLVLIRSPLLGQAASRALGEPFAWQVIQKEGRPTISGMVLGPSGRGLEGVQVFIPDLLVGAITDEEGHFEFEAPPPGEWMVSLQLLGFESLERQVTVVTGASVRIAAVLARQMALCTLACVGTACTDLGIEVVDSVAGRRPPVPVTLRLEFEGRVEESVTPYDPDSRVTTTWVGLGKSVETVGWHSIEIEAEGYRPWRVSRVWLELVPMCNGYLLGRSHRAALIAR